MDENSYTKNFNIPELIRDYEIGDRLGEGGYGVVVKAYHKRLRKAVVIKESKLVVSEEKARAEVDILKNLHHPNLPQVYDFFISNGIAYTVMDYIEGESVGSMLKRNYRFSRKEVYKYAKLLLQALDYLHSQQIPIIHGDIKPDNVMITPDGNLCLIDFNISGVSDGKYAYITGYTPNYCAPEQEREYKVLKERLHQKQTEAIVSSYVSSYNTGPSGTGGTRLGIPSDRRSDVYSAGATIYRMYTGQVYNRNNPAVMEANASDAFIYVLNKSLQENPDRRFQSGKEMLKAFEQIHKKDKSYRGLVIRTIVFRIVLVIGVLIGIALVGEGRRRTEKEHLREYNNLIDKMETARAEESGPEDFDELYEDALKLYPNRDDAYFQRAMWLYECHDYEGGLDFIERSLQDTDIDFDTKSRANMFHILGNCYYELGVGKNQSKQARLENLEEAAYAFEDSIDCNGSNVNVYTDYAITLAQLGHYDESEKILESAEKLGVEDDLMYLTRGEIGLIRIKERLENSPEGTVESDNIDKVLSSFSRCINETGDEYLQYRACIGAGEAYEIAIRQTGIEKGTDSQEFIDIIQRRLTLFENMIQKLPMKYSLQLLQNMVIYCDDAYKATNNREFVNRETAAVSEIIASGNADFETYDNLWKIYDRDKDYEKALQLLQNIEDRYADDYRLYKRFAFTYLETEWENDDGTTWDYSGFSENYKKAWQKYDALEDRNKDDNEMESLKVRYEELQKMGRIQ